MYSVQYLELFYKQKKKISDFGIEGRELSLYSYKNNFYVLLSTQF